MSLRRLRHAANGLLDAATVLPGAAGRAPAAAARLPAALSRIPAAAVHATGTVARASAAEARTVVQVLQRRRVHRADGRTSIRVRGVHRPGSEAMSKDLCAELRDVAGVARAEVNAVLGLVMVVHGDGVPVDALIEVIEEIENRHGVAAEPFGRRAEPAHRQAIVREAGLAAAYLSGGGAAIAGSLMRRTLIPPGLGSLMAMAESTPQVRDLLSRHIGRAAADMVLGSGAASLQTLAQQPIGLLLGSTHRFIRLSEMRGHHDTWTRRSGHLVQRDGAFEAPPLDLPPRPVPLPYGPVERAAWTVPAALSGAAGTYLITRDTQRTQGVLAAGVPRAARMGREAFATQLGRLAAGRDIVVLEPDSLRKLDRVDLVIADASALQTGDLMIEDVVPVAEAITSEEAYERAHALVDLEHLDARHEDGMWAVAPFKASRAAAAARVPQHVRARAAALRRRGATVLLLTRQDAPAALVPVLTELDPLAEELIAVAHRAGAVAVAGSATLAERLAADRAVAGGPRLAASVRACQEEGHVVALVSARGGDALAAADVGIGLLHGSRRPPWGAHLLCGPGLAEACRLLEAVPTARAVSTRAARIAGVGSGSGLLLAAAGSAAGSARRAQFAVDIAALSAFATGTWSGLAWAKRPEPLPLDRTPWHAWPVHAVLDRLDSSALGIGAHEAARRRSDTGEEPAPPSLAEVTVAELDNPLTPALAAGAGVSAVIGSITDAALIGSVLGVNALLSGVQRVRADRALRQLVDLSAVRVRLRRPTPGGRAAAEEDRATADRLVMGDVVLLAAGDAVPADLRLMSAKGLEVDESSLTGESQLVTKSPRPSASPSVADRCSMLYQGTVIAAGEATGVVVATGAQTEIGRTTRAAAGERRPGGVEQRLRELTELTVPVAIGAGAVLFVSDLLRGNPLAQALGPAVSLAVAAVPEGLPFVATAAELATARRMSRRGALVRNPTTIEALGRIDILCFDKTGTLTEGRLRLRQVSDGVSTVPVKGLPADRREIVAAAIRATPDRGGRKLPHPTDRAIARAAKKLRVDPSEGLGAWERVAELPFEPARGYHAVLGQADDGQRLSVKGAPEIVLERCRDWRTDAGVVAFDDQAREKVGQEVDRLARLGYRVLAVAEREASGRQDLTESRIDRLCLSGLLCIADPVRPTAADAVRRLRRAGVDVVMITGDHPTTAEAIAAELGLLNGRILTGVELDAVDDADLAGVIAGVSVFARVSPAQKARIVAALRAAGRVVAVTGDGANDAPAIRLADVGIALGERATSAARETADVVITDNRIETITDAVADCRAMWRSTRDALAVLLGGNLGEIAFTLGTGLISGRSPLGVRQLLLVNLLTDMVPAIALAARPPSGVTHEELLAEGPDRSLGAALTREVTIRAGVTAGAAMAAWLLSRVSGTRAQADTTGLVALVATQLAQTLLAGGRDPLVLASSLGTMAALGIIVQVPGLSHFFGCRPLLPHCWALALTSAGSSALAAVVLARLIGGPLEIAAGETAGEAGGAA